MLVSVAGPAHAVDRRAVRQGRVRRRRGHHRRRRGRRRHQPAGPDPLHRHPGDGAVRLQPHAVQAPRRVLGRRPPPRTCTGSCSASGSSSPRGTRTATRATTGACSASWPSRSTAIWTDTGAMQLDAGLVLPDLLPDEFGKNLDYARRAQTAAANHVGFWGAPTYCGIGPSQDDPLEVTVNWDADGNDADNVNGEWVDVINSGANVVSLAGWWVRDAAYRGQQGARLRLPGRRPGRARRAGPAPVGHGTDHDGTSSLGPGRARSSPTSRAARSGSATAPGCSTRRATCGPGTCTPAAPPAELWHSRRVLITNHVLSGAVIGAVAPDVGQAATLGLPVALRARRAAALRGRRRAPAQGRRPGRAARPGRDRRHRPGHPARTGCCPCSPASSAPACPTWTSPAGSSSAGRRSRAGSTRRTRGSRTRRCTGSPWSSPRPRCSPWPWSPCSPAARSLRHR